MMRKLSQVLLAVGIVSLLCMGVVKTIPYIVHYRLVRQTKQIVKAEVRGAIADYDAERSGQDAWGTSLRYTKTRTEHAHAVLVVSAGPDKRFGTDDDISDAAMDLNKSQIIGEYVGERTKEFGKGLIEGLKHKSKFSEPTAEKE